MKINLKAILASGLMFLLTQGIALAHDTVWLDSSAEIDKFSNVAIFPVAENDRNKFSAGCDSVYANYNEKLSSRLAGNIKKIQFYGISELLENEKIKLKLLVLLCEKNYWMNTMMNH